MNTKMHFKNCKTYLVDESSAVGPNDGDIRTDYEVMTLGYVVVVDSRNQADYVRESDRGMSWTVQSGHQVLQQTEAKIQQVNSFDWVAFVVCGRNLVEAFGHLFEASLDEVDPVAAAGWPPL